MCEENKETYKICQKYGYSSQHCVTYYLNHHKTDV